MYKKVFFLAAALVPFVSFAQDLSIDDQIDAACESAHGGYHQLKKENSLMNPENPARVITQPVLDAFNYVIKKNSSLVGTTASSNFKSCKSLLTDELKRRGQHQ